MQLSLLLWELPEGSKSKGKGRQPGNEASLRPLPLTPSVSLDKPWSLSRPLLPHLQKTLRDENSFSQWVLWVPRDPRKFQRALSKGPDKTKGVRCVKGQREPENKPLYSDA